MRSDCSFDFFQNILNHCVQSVPNDKSSLETCFDYQRLNDDKNLNLQLQQQLQEISQFDPHFLKTKEEALAFWINCYNFFMITKVLKQGFQIKPRPINSVKQLGTFLKPFKAFSDLDFKVRDTLITLDQIEKKILLGTAYKFMNWKDARIHFAVNCASVACPALSKKIYIPNCIDQQLNESVVQALKTPRHLFIQKNTVHLTELFKWYAQDFIDEQGSVFNFILKFNQNKEMTDLIKDAPTVKYIKYNWNLNTLKNF